MAKRVTPKSIGQKFTSLVNVPPEKAEQAVEDLKNEWMDDFINKLTGKKPVNESFSPESYLIEQRCECCGEGKSGIKLQFPGEAELGRAFEQLWRMFRESYSMHMMTFSSEIVVDVDNESRKYILDISQPYGISKSHDSVKAYFETEEDLKIFFDDLIMDFESFGVSNQVTVEREVKYSQGEYVYYLEIECNGMNPVDTDIVDDVADDGSHPLAPYLATDDTDKVMTSAVKGKNRAFEPTSSPFTSDNE